MVCVGYIFSSHKLPLYSMGKNGLCLFHRDEVLGEHGLGIQFGQFENFWLGRILRPKASRNLNFNYFKVHSWLTYGWKTVSLFFILYFHTFHKNTEGVLFKITLSTPISIVLDGVLFIYAFTNTNTSEIFVLLLLDQIFFVRVIVDILSANSHLNGLQDIFSSSFSKNCNWKIT